MHYVVVRCATFSAIVQPSRLCFHGHSVLISQVGAPHTFDDRQWMLSSTINFCKKLWAGEFQAYRPLQLQQQQQERAGQSSHLLGPVQ
jgi:hypothetical protein